MKILNKLKYETFSVLFVFINYSGDITDHHGNHTSFL